MIDIQESTGTVTRFASGRQIPFRILLDLKGEVANAYRIVGVPTMILIDKYGKILSRNYMSIDSVLETLYPKK